MIEIDPNEIAALALDRLQVIGASGLTASEAIELLKISIDLDRWLLDSENE